MFDGWGDIREADQKSQENALRSIIAAVINTVSTKTVKPSDLVYEEPANQEELTEDQVLSLAESMGVVKLV